jgi:hypothetical protein
MSLLKGKHEQTIMFKLFTIVEANIVVFWVRHRTVS